MGLKFDKWSLLKIFEVAFTTSCLITKRVTDDEAQRLFLYLQKLSREWSLLNNVTWDRIGSAVADATYGGYVIITSALLIGRLIGELPTEKRVTEMVLLGLGAVLFVILGSLEFAALDSVPPDLIDNAAILGTLSLTTAALFLLDLAGPRAKKPTLQTQPKSITRALEVHKMQKTREPFSLEPEFARIENARLENERNGKLNDDNKNQKHNGKADKHKFDVYPQVEQELGKDRVDSFEKSNGKVEEHSPVWSKIQKGQYGKYSDIVTPNYLYPQHSPDGKDYKQDYKLDARERERDRTPSSPGEPGYVQYTAKRWGQPINGHSKGVGQIPTQV